MNNMVDKIRDDKQGQINVNLTLSEKKIIKKAVILGGYKSFRDFMLSCANVELGKNDKDVEISNKKKELGELQKNNQEMVEKTTKNNLRSLEIVDEIKVLDSKIETINL